MCDIQHFKEAATLICAAADAPNLSNRQAVITEVVRQVTTPSFMRGMILCCGDYEIPDDLGRWAVKVLGEENNLFDLVPILAFLVDPTEQHSMAQRAANAFKLLHNLNGTLLLPCAESSNCDCRCGETECGHAFLQFLKSRAWDVSCDVCQTTEIEYPFYSCWQHGNAEKEYNTCAQCSESRCCTKALRFDNFEQQTRHAEEHFLSTLQQKLVADFL